MKNIKIKQFIMKKDYLNENIKLICEKADSRFRLEWKDLKKD